MVVRNGGDSVNLRHLEYFIAIAEKGSVSKAAEALYVSQPSLSRVLKTMETEMGVPLFRRTPKGVSLTEQGEKLYGTAKSAIGLLNTAEQSIKSKGTQKPALTVYAAPIGSSPLDAVAAFERLHPEIAVDYHLIMCDYGSFTYPCRLSQENTVVMVPSLGEMPSGNDVIFKKFQRLDACIVVPESHRLAGRSEVGLDELRDETFILPAANTIYWHYAQGFFRDVGFTPKIEEKEICEEPMNEIRYHANAIALLYNKFGYSMRQSPDSLEMDFRDRLMRDRGDIVFSHIRTKAPLRQGVQRVRIAAEGAERWSYLMWAKKIEFTDDMATFIDFVTRFYE